VSIDGLGKKKGPTLAKTIKQQSHKITIALRDLVTGISL
jgi:hypothetical protein